MNVRLNRDYILYSQCLPLITEFQTDFHVIQPVGTVTEAFARNTELQNSGNVAVDSWRVGRRNCGACL